MVEPEDYDVGIPYNEKVADIEGKAVKYDVYVDIGEEPSVKNVRFLGEGTIIWLGNTRIKSKKRYRFYKLT